MADLGLTAAPDGAFWDGRRVLLTGHTGFKGAWMALWLARLGARVTGLALEAPRDAPSLFALTRVSELVDHRVADIRDYDAVVEVLAQARPEVVIHMAAQALVRPSFDDPRGTYETNVMGTVNVFEAVRRHGDVRAVVNVTSDKCYENREWEWAYREDEPKGGHDPYSSSKGCAELVTDAFRRSYFSAPDSVTRLASVRAGNVIGGGDWGHERLVPDLMRAALAGERVRVRNPAAIRPWQHVLCPLSGYLTVAQALWEDPAAATGWNFGPSEDDARPVSCVVEQVCALWPGLPATEDPGPHPHEARYLKLDSSRARARLRWLPAWDLNTALARTVAWYRALEAGEDPRAVSLAQIEDYEGQISKLALR